ncbi:exo1 protein [Phlyctema vagabunda]|uniref:Exo1 protein n=1 Tax=Phlyctema vagabunda TaxID=108571 RepID=A0ABR4PSM1_9HELO
MGIQGLLPLLKSIQKPTHVSNFKGKTLGIDAYGWLHRSTIACAMDLALGVPTTKFVEACMHKVRMLQHHGVIPFLIFDGDYLPSKAATEAERRKRREECRRAGQEFLNAGKKALAFAEFQKAIDVSPLMARQLIEELKAAEVQYIVAPYEADAQMVYLERTGIIDGILSEDSDLLVFGAKCLLTKLDHFGACIEINKADFCACTDVNLTGWSDTEFRVMTIMSGCDYLAGINNMGLKTAYRLVRKHKTIEKVLRMLQFEGKHSIPKGYLEAFRQAEFTFLHQRVYCPKTKSLVFHTKPQQSVEVEKMPFIGAYIEPAIAEAVANGDLDPMTKLPLQLTPPKKIIPRSLYSTPRSNQNRSVSCSDLKKGGPMDAFLKGKRIPLQELDPNTLEYSPSQEEALRRNSGPWVASPAPRSYLHQSSTQPEPELPRSPPSSGRRASGQAQTLIGATSEPSPKRARLCADLNQTLSPRSKKKVGLGTSRFFSSTPEPSPTTHRATRVRRSKPEDINIFSDDSVEDAMLNLPDFDGVTPKSGKKVAVFREETASGDGSVSSQGTLPNLTPSTSMTSSAEQPPTPTDIKSKAGTSLKEQFSFCSTPQSMPRARSYNSLQTPNSSITAQRKSKIPRAVKPEVATPKSTIGTFKMPSGLQSLGASAANRPKLPMTPPMTPVAGLKQTRTTARRSLLANCQDVAYEPVDPASIPLPPADETENLALTQGGSEDHIIHDSEEEEDEITLPLPPQPLSLQRFAFAN